MAAASASTVAHMKRGLASLFTEPTWQASALAPIGLPPGQQHDARGNHQMQCSSPAAKRQPVSHQECLGKPECVWPRLGAALAGVRERAARGLAPGQQHELRHDHQEELLHLRRQVVLRAAVPAVPRAARRRSACLCSTRGFLAQTVSTETGDIVRADESRGMSMSLSNL